VDNAGVLLAQERKRKTKQCFLAHCWRMLFLYYAGTKDALEPSKARIQGEANMREVKSLCQSKEKQEGVNIEGSANYVAHSADICFIR